MTKNNNNCKLPKSSKERELTTDVSFRLKVRFIRFRVRDRVRDSFFAAGRPESRHH